MCCSLELKNEGSLCRTGEKGRLILAQIVRKDFKEKVTLDLNPPNKRTVDFNSGHEECHVRWKD